MTNGFAANQQFYYRATNYFTVSKKLLKTFS